MKNYRKGTIPGTKAYFHGFLCEMCIAWAIKMSRELVEAIKRNTEVLFTNADIMLQTCDLDYVLCDMPIYKHVYHMFHSCDQWYINPTQYTEPKFHVPNLNSLDIPSEKKLSKEELAAYLADIRKKIMEYLDSLTDEMLYDIPDGCSNNRLCMIISQFRHFYAHLGNINATTIIETNLWPRVIGTNGMCGKSTEGLYE